MASQATIVIDGRDFTERVTSWRLTYGSNATQVDTHPITLATARGTVDIDNHDQIVGDSQGGPIRILVGDQVLWQGVCSRTDPATLGSVSVARFELASPKALHLNAPALLSWNRPTGSPWSLLSSMMQQAGAGPYWGTFTELITTNQFGQIEVLGWQPHEGPWVQLLSRFAHLCGGWALESRNGTVRIAPWTQARIDSAIDLTHLQPLRGSILVTRPSMTIAYSDHHAIERSTTTKSTQFSQTIRLTAGQSKTITVDRPSKDQWVTTWSATTATANCAISDTVSQLWDFTFKVTNSGTTTTNAVVNITALSNSYVVADTLSTKRSDLDNLTHPTYWNAPQWIQAPFRPPVGLPVPATIPSSLPIQLAESLADSPGWLHAKWSLHDPAVVSRLPSVQPGDAVKVQVGDRESTILVMAITLSGKQVHASTYPHASALNMELIGLGTQPIPAHELAPFDPEEPPEDETGLPAPPAPIITQATTDQLPVVYRPLDPPDLEPAGWEVGWLKVGDANSTPLSQHNPTASGNIPRATATRKSTGTEVHTGSYLFFVRYREPAEIGPWSPSKRVDIFNSDERAYWDPVRLKVVVPRPPNIPAGSNWAARYRQDIPAGAPVGIGSHVTIRGSYSASSEIAFSAPAGTWWVEAALQDTNGTFPNGWDYRGTVTVPSTAQLDNEWPPDLDTDYEWAFDHSRMQLAIKFPAAPATPANGYWTARIRDVRLATTLEALPREAKYRNAGTYTFARRNLWENLETVPDSRRYKVDVAYAADSQGSYKTVTSQLNPFNSVTPIRWWGFNDLEWGVTWVPPVEPPTPSTFRDNNILYTINFNWLQGPAPGTRVYFEGAFYPFVYPWGNSIDSLPYSAHLNADGIPPETTRLRGHFILSTTANRQTAFLEATKAYAAEVQVAVTWVRGTGSLSNRWLAQQVWNFQPLPDGFMPPEPRVGFTAHEFGDSLQHSGTWLTALETPEFPDYIGTNFDSIAGSVPNYTTDDQIGSITSTNLSRVRQFNREVAGDSVGKWSYRPAWFFRLPSNVVDIELPDAVPTPRARFDPDALTVSIARPSGLGGRDDWTYRWRTQGGSRWFTGAANTTDWGLRAGLNQHTASFLWVRSGTFEIEAGERAGSGAVANWQAYPTLTIPESSLGDVWSPGVGYVSSGTFTWTVARNFEDTAFLYTWSTPGTGAGHRLILEQRSTDTGNQWSWRLATRNASGDHTDIAVTQAWFPTQLAILSRGVGDHELRHAVLPAFADATAFSEQSGTILGVKVLLPGLEQPESATSAGLTIARLFDPADEQ